MQNAGNHEGKFFRHSLTWDYYCVTRAVNNNNNNNRQTDMVTDMVLEYLIEP